MLLRGFLVLVLSAGVVAVAPAPIAQAQTDGAQAKREARKLLKAGDRAMKKGDSYSRRDREEKAREWYSKALDSYKAAYEVYPQPQIYFAIGNAEEKLGLYVDAHGHYSRLLEEAEEVSDALRAAVDTQIDSVLSRLSVVKLKAGPERATVFVDEREIGVAPLAEPLVLEPGPHRISVRKDGYTPGQEEFQSAEGDKLEKTIELEPLPTVDDTPPPPPPPPKPLGPPPGRGILIASLVTTGALAAGATISGVIALSKHGTHTDGAKSTSERQDAGDSGKKFALTSDVLLGATAVAAGFTAYYYYGVYKPRAAARRSEHEALQKRSWLVPYVAGDGAGVAIGGRF